MTETHFSADLLPGNSARTKLTAALALALAGVAMVAYSHRSDKTNAKVMACAQARFNANGGDLQKHFKACQSKRVVQ